MNTYETVDNNVVSCIGDSLCDLFPVIFMLVRAETPFTDLFSISLRIDPSTLFGISACSCFAIWSMLHQILSGSYQLTGLNVAM